LSQRTRGRTIGAASPSQPKADPGAQPSPRATLPTHRSAQPRDTRRAGGPRDRSGSDPGVIARTLRIVADELERDPELARRVAAEIARLGAAPGKLDDRQEGAPEDAAPRAKGTGARVFRSRLVPGVDAALGPGIPDPFVLRERLGAAGLEAALAELRLGTLRAIIREHQLDPDGRLVRLNDADRLRAAIVSATAG
jgi:hypothetical protein